MEMLCVVERLIRFRIVCNKNSCLLRNLVELEK